MDAIYLPINAYHVERRAELNEFPIGLGFGKNGYFFIGHKDSYRRPSWIAGKRFSLVEGKSSKIDIAVFAVSREYKGEYRLFPGVLPVFSVGKEWKLEATVIPKIPQTNGPVVFSWITRGF